MIRLVILGAGTGLPARGYSPAGHLVLIEEQPGDTRGIPLVFDLGPGTLFRLEAAGVDYRDLETIFLTHHHSDHTLDLVSLLQAYDSTPGWERSKPLRLVGGRHTGNFYRRLMAAYPGFEPETYRLDIVEMGAEPLVTPNWTVRAVPTRHTSNSLAYRLEAQGKAIVFTGDATFVPELAELARGADILVSECSFPGDQSPGGHLAAGEVGRIAQEAGVKHLILVHLYPQARQADVLTQIGMHYSGNAEIATDGLEVRL